MFYTLQKKGWNDARFIQTWDGVVVAVSYGFELFLGQPVKELMLWAQERTVSINCKQEINMTPVSPHEYPLVIYHTNGAYKTYCALLPEVHGAGKTPQDACTAGWLGVSRAIQERAATGRPVPTPEEVEAASGIVQ